VAVCKIRLSDFELLANLFLFVTPKIIVLNCIKIAITCFSNFVADSGENVTFLFVGSNTFYGIIYITN